MHAVVVFFIGYSFNLKIANQTISICSRFVLALSLTSQIQSRLSCRL